ncbi:MAG TPA: PQQ-binding-like beta-propeller repeat protein [Kiritimatiellia bacterium]|nr:PQQ-binding-like beta-propeller repeat protein [Kiritimatiellia bacterium]HPS06462.1 PQQ-binding-like beta-propeller repeat protein [Kiritimatiellia bacterium]
MVSGEKGLPDSFDVQGEMWASTLVADGKVYVGTRRGEFVVLAAEAQKKLLSSNVVDSAISGTPVAANGTLYITSQKRLYALRRPE